MVIEWLPNCFEQYTQITNRGRPLFPGVAGGELSDPILFPGFLVDDCATPATAGLFRVVVSVAVVASGDETPNNCDGNGATIGFRDV